MDFYCPEDQSRHFYSETVYNAHPFDACACVSWDEKKEEKGHFYFEHGMQLSEPKQYHHITVARKYSHISITENVQECIAIVAAITKQPPSLLLPSSLPSTIRRPPLSATINDVDVTTNEVIASQRKSASACSRFQRFYLKKCAVIAAAAATTTITHSQYREREWLRPRWRRHDDLANIYEHFKWEKFVA